MLYRSCICTRGPCGLKRHRTRENVTVRLTCLCLYQTLRKSNAGALGGGNPQPVSLGGGSLPGGHGQCFVALLVRIIQKDGLPNPTGGQE